MTEADTECHISDHIIDCLRFRMTCSTLFCHMQCMKLNILETADIRWSSDLAVAVKKPHLTWYHLAVKVRTMFKNYKCYHVNSHKAEISVFQVYHHPFLNFWLV